MPDYFGERMAQQAVMPVMHIQAPRREPKLSIVIFDKHGRPFEFEKPIMHYDLGYFIEQFVKNGASRIEVNILNESEE